MKSQSSELFNIVSKYDNIIFDLDGTLYDEIEYRKIAYSYAIRAIVNKDEEMFLSLYKKTIDKFKKNPNSKNIFNELLIENQMSLNFLPTALNAYRNAKLDDMKKINSHKNDLYEIIKKGKKVFLITNGRTAIQKSKIKALGIEKYFIKIIICDEEIGMPIKPSHKVFSMLKIDNYKNNVVMIGDSDTDKNFAINSEIDFFHYKFGEI